MAINNFKILLTSLRTISQMFTILRILWIRQYVVVCSVLCIIHNNKSLEFAFPKLIKCGYCGSGISADEKFKKLKDGGVNRHVYYFCTKARNIDCKNPAINEPSLIDELIKLMDRIDLDELGVKSKVEQEMIRLNRFKAMLGEKEKGKNIDVNARDYAKYLLKEGTLVEKRELLFFLKSKLILKDRKIILQ